MSEPPTPSERRLSGIRAQLGAGLKQARTLAESVSRRKTRSVDSRDGFDDRLSVATPSEPATPASVRYANTVVSPRTMAAREAEKEALLAGLPPEYYEAEHDPVLGELQKLPPRFDPATLDQVVEERAAVLEVVSEKLSAHVLQNYAKFVSGVNEVVCVERDLQAAHAICRQSRAQLGGALAEVRADISIARRQRVKQGLSDMALLLLDLQACYARVQELREAQEAGDFAAAFWLAAQCSRALEALSALRVTADLAAGVQQQYEAALQRLEATLMAACADFRPALYSKVLEGYHYLGNMGSLGDEAMHGFASAVNSGALRVVRTMVLARARSGIEEKARGATILQEAVRLLPADLFRQCLTQVLMVIFDILLSHFRMVRWHEDQIAQHIANAAQLREECARRREALGTGGPGPSEGTLGLQAGAAKGVTDPNAGGPPPAEGASVPGLPGDSEGPGTAGRPDANGAHPAIAAAGSAGGKAFPRSNMAHPPDGGPAVEAVGAQQNGASGPPPGGGLANGWGGEEALGGAAGQPPEDPAAAELAALEEKEREEGAWAEAMLRVSESLSGGRRWLWDEAARKIGILLSAPAALEGEHFLQILEWTQTMLMVGEAFSGSESSMLREAISRQSARFFQAYHTSNLQVLYSMLERERWVPLPLLPGGLPNLTEALEGTREAPACRFDTNSFAEWVAHGNPWRKQDPGESAAAEEVHESSSEEEAEEVYADSIDEDNQRVKRSGSSSISGRALDGSPTMTNASWRLMKWSAEYAGLMRVLRSDCGTVYSGLCELFEMYFLHVYFVFSDVPIMELVAQKQVKAQGGADLVPSRLRTAIMRILTRSLPKYRKLYLPPPRSQSNLSVASNGSPGPQKHLHTVQSARDMGLGTGDAGSTGGPMSPGAPTALCNSGNMFGLIERKVASDSLAALAGQLTGAHTSLAEKLVGRSDVPEHHSLDSFFQTIKAVPDLREVMYRGAARANLPLTWLPDRLVEQEWALQEPPTKASRWVAAVLQALKQLRQRLDTAAALSPSDLDLVWRHAAHYVAEQVLEGYARAGARKHCTPMGRSAMTLDLQAIQRGLQQLAGQADTAQAVADALRIVDNFVKAYYISWGDELQRWALTHPEYTKNQLINLVTCVADSQGIKKKERTAFIQQLEAALAEIGR
eukprot:jgi/Botrbrau1/10797/Bobra.0064s0003.1